MHSKLALLSAVATTAVCLSARAGYPVIVASDNGDLYPSNPDHNWSAFNGGGWV